MRFCTAMKASANNTNAAGNGAALVTAAPTAVTRSATSRLTVPGRLALRDSSADPGALCAPCTGELVRLGAAASLRVGPAVGETSAGAAGLIAGRSASGVDVMPGDVMPGDGSGGMAEPGGAVVADVCAEVGVAGGSLLRAVGVGGTLGEVTRGVAVGSNEPGTLTEGSGSGGIVTAGTAVGTNDGGRFTPSDGSGRGARFAGWRGKGEDNAVVTRVGAATVCGSPASAGDGADVPPIAVARPAVRATAAVRDQAPAPKLPPYLHKHRDGEETRRRPTGLTAAAANGAMAP